MSVATAVTRAGPQRLTAARVAEGRVGAGVRVHSSGPCSSLVIR